MVEQDPLCGDLFEGRLTLLEHLGEGRRGPVYRGLQHPGERLVAIKLLSVERSRQPDAEMRFQQALRVADRVHHPAFPPIHGSGVTRDGRSYLFRELLRGTPLSSRLHQDGPLALEDAWDLWIQLVEAVAAAHHAGVAHGGLRAEIVILCSADTGDPRVHLTGPGGELIQDGGKEAPLPASAADVRALGRLLMEMLTGSPAEAYPGPRPPSWREALPRSPLLPGLAILLDEIEGSGRGLPHDACALRRRINDVRRDWTMRVQRHPAGQPGDDLTQEDGWRAMCSPAESAPPTILAGDTTLAACGPTGEPTALLGSQVSDTIGPAPEPHPLSATHRLKSLVLASALLSLVWATVRQGPSDRVRPERSQALAAPAEQRTTHAEVFDGEKFGSVLAARLVDEGKAGSSAPTRPPRVLRVRFVAARPANIAFGCNSAQADVKVQEYGDWETSVRPGWRCAARMEGFETLEYSYDRLRRLAERQGQAGRVTITVSLEKEHE